MQSLFDLKVPGYAEAGGEVVVGSAPPRTAFYMGLGRAGFCDERSGIEECVLQVVQFPLPIINLPITPNSLNQIEVLTMVGSAVGFCRLHGVVTQRLVLLPCAGTRPTSF